MTLSKILAKILKTFLKRIILSKFFSDDIAMALPEFIEVSISLNTVIIWGPLVVWCRHQQPTDLTWITIILTKHLISKFVAEAISYSCFMMDVR